MRFWLKLSWMGACVLALLPTSAWGFSFLPGGFGPTEKISTIQLSGTASYNDPNSTIVFSADVTTINTNAGVYNIPAGDVTFSSEVVLVGGSLTVLGTTIAFADFENTAGIDFEVTDVADGGNVLLQGDYDGVVDWDAQQLSTFLPVTGSAAAGFSPAGGDAGFLAALSTGLSFGGDLSGFAPDDLCGIVTLCFAPNMTTWTAGASMDIEVTPEPGSLLLLGAALGGMAFLRRRQLR